MGVVMAVLAISALTAQRVAGRRQRWSVAR
jgi:hypothetical protein